MKTIIVYDSKSGCTKKCAEYIHTHRESDLFHVTEYTGDFSEYDTVLLMTPVHVGQIKKSIKQLIQKHETVLMNKDTHILISSMNGPEFSQMVEQNFSETVRNHLTIQSIGGAYYFEKLGFFSKFIIKKITGITETTEDIKYDVLDQYKA